MSNKVKEITEVEFEELVREFYIEPKHRNKLTNEEIKELAEQLNRKINIPIVKETGEEKIIIKIILKIDNFLYDNLPNEFYDLVRSTEKGIDEQEAKRLVKRLTKMANEKINLPFLPEVAENFVLRFVIGMIVKSARKNLNFEKVKNESDRLNVPESADDIEKIVED